MTKRRLAWAIALGALSVSCGGSDEAAPPGQVDSSVEDTESLVDTSTVPDVSAETSADTEIDSAEDTATDTATADDGDTLMPDTTIADTIIADTTIADTADTAIPDTTIADTTIADTADTAIADTAPIDTGAGLRDDRQLEVYEQRHLVVDTARTLRALRGVDGLRDGRLRRAQRVLLEHRRALQPLPRTRGRASPRRRPGADCTPPSGRARR